MRKSYPSDLRDAEWQLIEPLLPAESAIGHPRDVQLREIVNAIFYVQREGCTWRALPSDFPPWQTVGRAGWKCGTARLKHCVVDQEQHNEMSPLRLR